MKRRKSIKQPEWMVEHPPQQCRKLMSSKVLRLLDEIASNQAKQNFNTEARAK